MTRTANQAEPATRAAADTLTACHHFPRCPAATAPGCAAARTVAAHPEQGWSLLCNGVVLFDDTGALRPDGSAVAPARGRPVRRPGSRANTVRPRSVRDKRSFSRTAGRRERLAGGDGAAAQR